MAVQHRDYWYFCQGVQIKAVLPKYILSITLIADGSSMDL